MAHYTRVEGGSREEGNILNNLFAKAEKICTAAEEIIIGEEEKGKNNGFGTSLFLLSFFFFPFYLMFVAGNGGKPDPSRCPASPPPRRSPGEGREQLGEAGEGVAAVVVAVLPRGEEKVALLGSVEDVLATTPLLMLFPAVS